MNNTFANLETASKLFENTKFGAKNRFIKGHKMLIFRQNYDFSITLNFGEGIDTWQTRCLFTFLLLESAIIH